jgi:hypothetical protein
MVVIIHPTNESDWSADTPIPVAAMASGQVPVRKLELWVDARLFDTQEFPGEHIYAYHAWSWMPLIEGGHSLYVRAIDANGRTADSNVVNIRAAAAAGFLAVKTTSGGETLQSLADQNGLTLDQVSAQNPSIAPLSPIPPGTQIFLPLQFAQIPTDAGSSSPSAIVSGPVDRAVIGQPGNATFLIERALNNSRNLPTPPVLAAAVGVCNVTLTIQDNSDPEDGFFVYGLTDGATSFHRLTSLQAHKGTGALQYSVPNQRGHVEFYVSSYNASGEAKSAPVAVDVTAPQCNPGSGSQGNVKYEGGYLIMPASIQMAYLYASVNGSTWQRIPTDHLFMSPTAGKVDLRSKVQQLLGGASSGEVDLDVWGWSGGVLEHLGQVHVNINFASLAICDLGTDCSGDMGSTHWVNAATVGSDQLKTTRAFRWSAQGIDITYGIWQVSTQPFPAEYSIGARRRTSARAVLPVAISRSISKPTCRPPTRLPSRNAQVSTHCIYGLQIISKVLTYRASCRSSGSLPSPAFTRQCCPRYSMCVWRPWLAGTLSVTRRTQSRSLTHPPARHPRSKSIRSRPTKWRSCQAPT